MIGVVDYGLGNVKAFVNIYRSLNLDVRSLRSPEDFKDIERLILPGVGAFDRAMGKLDDSGMREQLERFVVDQKVPVLGVCVGMQMMANCSDEGDREGLGWIGGKVRRFAPTNDVRWRLPHMGWNDVVSTESAVLFRNLEQQARFYFLHSFYFDVENAADKMSSTDYFGEFSSAVAHDNIYGVQFHPEKSHSWGVQLLRNFALLNA